MKYYGDKVAMDLSKRYYIINNNPEPLSWKGVVGNLADLLQEDIVVLSRLRVDSITTSNNKTTIKRII